MSMNRPSDTTTGLTEDGDKVTDAERFSLAVSQIIGKRLTYQELTGKLLGGETSLN